MLALTLCPRLRSSAASLSLLLHVQAQGPLGVAARHRVHQDLEVPHQRRIRFRQGRPTRSHMADSLGARRGRRMRGLLGEVSKTSRIRDSLIPVACRTAATPP